MISKKNLVSILFELIGLFAFSQPTISVSGNPVFSSSVFNLTEAGSNFVSSVTSSSGSYISISNSKNNLRNNGKFNWMVTINKADINWNALLEVQAHRTGDGQPGSSQNNYITGGMNFQTVNAMPSTFIYGGAVRNNVPIEYKINNISVLIPANNYETTIYYTVYEQ